MASNFESISEQSVKELQRDTLQQGETQDAHFAAQPFIREPDSRAPNLIIYVDTSISSRVIYSYCPFPGLDTIPYMTPQDDNSLESQGFF